ncbi:esterase-like activity of phytase family protein [Aliirhizobium terrae]|uniref:esterase-like activity of phytase family protein n=1 Tax=Terrirhizobium terrae TaxID=2926709 RepID=UPI0025766A1E|nr:esterase-like activity of phytase family protein [Rhizobium sp. CC-CFT758]WJH42167.1 esterase-like activity of phytase family protein [Rhizobium sp. CC-CFT758]
MTAQDAVSVTATQITRFKTGSDQRRFGLLEFVGGIDFRSGDGRVQSLSSIRFRADGTSFVSVLDTGEWLIGKIERDADGKLSGLADVAVSPIRLRDGRAGSKAASDAEGLALRRGEALVSFEQQHRVDAYPDPGFETASPSRNVDFLIPRSELRRNGGMETLVASPASGPLRGGLIAITEHSLDENGNLFAAIIDGPLKGQFKLVRHDPYDATDGAFLPNGDLLLLERSFSFLGGLGMRIRLISGQDIRPGAAVDGEVLIDADMGYAIDNMEGIDVIQGADGKPHVILVSDDNGSILQRNVMLEFILNQ